MYFLCLDMHMIGLFTLNTVQGSISKSPNNKCVEYIIRVPEAAEIYLPSRTFPKQLCTLWGYFAFEYTNCCWLSTGSSFWEMC